MKKILVCEDEERTRKIICNYLKKKYKIIEAEDGKKSIELCSSEKPDLIIMDIGLPGINGIETVSCIQKNSGYVIPVIFMARMGNKRSEVQMNGLKVIAFMEKPFLLKELQNEINKIIAKD